MILTGMVESGSEINVGTEEGAKLKENRVKVRRR
jgi:hypothetical protein